MDLKRKIENAGMHIEFIARHDDADLAVREAALNAVLQKIEAERQAARDRVQAKIEAAVQGGA